MLPSGVKHRLVNELDKRLDLDIDQILDTPKLRLQLSPAELDKRLLELYKDIAGNGPRGDILRIIGGGNDVALQDLYLRKQALKERAKNPGRSTTYALSLGPTVLDDEATEKKTASQWVNLALRRNLAKSSSNDVGTGGTTNPPTNTDETKKNNQNKMTMTFGLDQFQRNKSKNHQVLMQKQQRTAPMRTASYGQFCPSISRKTCTLLI